MSKQLLSRRLFLGGASAGALVVGTGALHDQVAAATRQGSLPRQVDVVVVGGGISGLVTARDWPPGGTTSCSPRRATASAAGCSTTT